MAQIYQTKQRRVILDFLFANSGRHMTTEEVLEALKVNGHKISRATVYRYLEKLADERALRRYTQASGRGVALYEYCGCSGGFYHLKCDACGNLQHLTRGNVSGLLSHIEADYGFIIDPERTIFHGTCGECSNKDGEGR